MRTAGADDVATYLEENVPVIDVLPEQVHQQKHIPDTANVPVDADDFVERVEQLAGGKQQPVVVYCANTECDASPKAGEKLEAAGFTDVIDFEGGLAEWRSAGKELAGDEAA